MCQSSCATQQIRAAGVSIYTVTVFWFCQPSFHILQSKAAAGERRWPPALPALLLGSVDSAASQAARSLAAEQSISTHCSTSVAHLLSTRTTLEMSYIVTNNQLILPPWDERCLNLPGRTKWLDWWQHSYPQKLILTFSSFRTQINYYK